ncbi:12143_t:CDS:2 [Acaulospora colombiana]|uniref:12143_t:CDS:1 n=1 Tax=Acaulospora colombiana TaxID=27376 RepID=A0ACA9LJT1_9GLOM|nr:12143_t:CDS:2 [Acaulospora colombiana]
MKVKFFLLIVFIFALANNVAGDDSSNGSNSDTTSSNNIKLGFGLTAMAVGASALGSFIPFLDLLFPYIPGLRDFRITHSKGFLASSLSFAAGVLTFLTIDDIYSTAISEFGTTNINPNYTTLVVTAIFSATIVLLILGRKVLDRIQWKSQEPEVSSTNTDEEMNIGGKKEDETQPTVIPQDVIPLRNLGFQVAIALALHNIPEGFTNFVTVVTNPQVGVLFAIALALQ